MSVIKRLLEPKEKRSESVSISDPEIWNKIFWPDYATSISGEDITQESAVRNTAVLNAVTILSGSVASLPLFLYHRLDDDGKERATDHPIYRILHDKPNSRMIAFTMWELCMVHCLLWGNFYAEKEYSGNKLKAIWPVPPNRVQVLTTPDYKDLFYRITRQFPNSQITGSPEQSGDTYIRPARDMVHVPGLGFNGIEGRSVIAMAREAIGLGLATEAFGARFFANNARPGIALKLAERFEDLSTEAVQSLKDSFMETHSGGENAHRPIFLEEGMDITTFSIPPEDAQFLETRAFQVTEIARMFNLPPHKIKDLTHATFTNIESQNLDYVIDSVRPWLARIEQTLSTSLLTEKEQDDYFAEFLMEGLLRADSAARGTFYREMFYTGAMNPNEIRARENLNPVEGGDQYYVPLNLVPVGTEPATPVSAPVIPSTDIILPVPSNNARELRSNSINLRRKIRESYHGVMHDSMLRVVKSERRNAEKAAKQHKDNRNAFHSWAQDYYTGPVGQEGTYQSVFKKQMTPPMTGLSAAVAPAAADQVNFNGDFTQDIHNAAILHTEKVAYRQSEQSKRRMQQLAAEAEDLEQSVRDEFDFAEERKPQQMADWETVRVEGMASKAVWALAGITSLYWVANPNCCPICAEMDGRKVGIESDFVGPDDTVGDLKPSWNVATPPLHDTCVCTIEPG